VQFLVSTLVTVATFIQMLCAVVDLRTARSEEARWLGAEDELVQEHPWRRQRGVRRELRSLARPGNSSRHPYIHAVLASWLMLFLASFVALVSAPMPSV